MELHSRRSTPFRVCRELAVLALPAGFWAAFYAPAWLESRTYVAEDVPYYFGLLSKLYGLAHGQPFTLWDESVGLGVPRFGSPQAAYFSPLAALFYLVPTERALSLFPPLALFLLTAATYAFLRTRLRILPSLFGAVSWVGMGTLVDHVQHPPVLETLVWLPVVLACWDRFAKTGRGGWAAATALAGAAAVAGGNPQYLLYGAVLAGGWMAGSALRAGPRARRIAVAAVTSGAAAILLGSFVLLGTAEFASQCQRTLPEAELLSRQYRATPMGLARAFAQELFLLPRIRQAQYPLHPAMSLWVLPLAAYAGVALRRRMGGIAVGSALFLLGALGPFSIPLLRAPVRMVVPAGFLLALLAAHGMQEWIDRRPRLRWAGAALVAWTLILTWTLHHPRLRFEVPGRLAAPAPVARAEPRLAFDLEQVPLYWVNAAQVLGVPTLVVYDPLVPRDLFEALFASQIGPLEGDPRLPQALSNNLIAIVRPDLPLMRAFDLRTLVGLRGGRLVFRRVAGLGRHFVASRVQVAGSRSERWRMAASEDWDPVRVALVDHPLSFEASPPSAVRPVRDEPDRQVLRLEGGGGLLVSSALFYPGWRVTVDGQPAQPLRADLALRAVIVPPGSHRVEWRYRPPWLVFSFGCMGLGLALCLLLLRLGRRPAARRS